MSEDPIDLGDDLIDLSGVTLRDLDQLGESILVKALRPLMEGADSDSEPVAGFQSRI
jgi:FXSXX-COOH protein